MEPTPIPNKSLFASASVAAHLLRGVLGVAAIVAAIDLAPQSTLASLALGMVALLAFRGCPICWALGLVETIVLRLRKGAAQPKPPDS